jgi:hypothetical protein
MTACQPVPTDGTEGPQAWFCDADHVALAEGRRAAWHEIKVALWVPPGGH